MNHYGKILGAVIGWLVVRHPAGAVLGLVLGHVLDAGWLRANPSSERAESVTAEHYALLGLEPEVSDDALHAAYRKKISEYHPDKVQNAAQEIRDLAEQRARAINQAYELILKQRRAERPRD